MGLRVLVPNIPGEAGGEERRACVMQVEKLSGMTDGLPVAQVYSIVVVRVASE